MRRSILLSTLVIAAAALAVSACGGSDGGSSTSAGAATAGIVSVAKVDGKDVLANDAGKTLYSAAVENGGMIRCVDACLSFWKPMLASSSAAKKASGKLDANFSVLRRPDGRQQLTFKGLPLYTFAEEGAGALEGDGFTDDFQGTHFEWQAARTSGSASSASSGSTTDSKRGGGAYGY